MAKKARTYSLRAREACELLGLQIKQSRIQRGWTRQALSERAGITLPTLGKIERGDPTVGIGLALEVATIVGVPLFVEEHRRLGLELARHRELVRLLPRRVVELRDDVDDDF